MNCYSKIQKQRHVLAWICICMNIYLHECSVYLQIYFLFTPVIVLEHNVGWISIKRYTYFKDWWKLETFKTNHLLLHNILWGFFYRKDGKRIYNIFIYGSISKAPSWPTRIYPFLNYYHIHSLQKLLTDFSKNSFIFMRYSSRFARSFSKSEFEGVLPEFPPSENRTFSSCGTEQHFWKFFSIAQCEWSPNLDSKFCNTSVVPTLPVNPCDSLCGPNLLFPDFAFLFDTNKSCLKNGSESKESFGAPKWFSFFTNCFIELAGGSGRQIFSQWFKETCNDMNSKYYYTLYRKKLLIAPYNFLSGMMKSMQ